MSCKPGTPCYSYGQDFVYPRNCGIDPCFVYKTGTDLVFYNGSNLPCTGIHTCDTSTLSFQKIDAAICNLQTQIQNCCSTTTTTSTTTSSTTTTTTTTAIPCNCFTVSGGGPETPFVQVTYLDCNGISQQTGAGGGFDANFCALLGSIVTDKSITDNGTCSGQCPPTTTTTTTGIPCNCYTVDGGTPSTPIEIIDYTDCNGVTQSTAAGGGVGAAFCAQVGSVVTAGSLTDNGACTGSCPTCCTTWMFIGSDSEIIRFQYVPCGGTSTVTIEPGASPEYRCVNNNYPVTQITGTPSTATNTQACCT